MLNVLINVIVGLTEGKISTSIKKELGSLENRKEEIGLCVNEKDVTKYGGFRLFFGEGLVNDVKDGDALLCTD